VRKADNLSVICEPIIWKIWDSRRLTTLWASTACYSDSFTYFINYYTSSLHPVFLIFKNKILRTLFGVSARIRPMLHHDQQVEVYKEP
jgi:hypothetical protein